MTAPVGEDSWVDFVDQESRAATTLEPRVGVLETFRRAVAAEPYSIKVWVAYCEYYWSLYTGCQPGSDAGWPAEEQQAGRDLFSLDAALTLWQDGYGAVRYRLSDSHELWNRWIALEMEQLAKTRTEQGVKRITHLFRNRLATPHSTWDDTSQMFSSFLSEYNKSAYYAEMQQITELAKDAKRIYGIYDRSETRLAVAARSGNPDEQKAVMREYLDWAVGQSALKRTGLAGVEICLALFDRALTGIFALDESTWTDYVVFISSAHSEAKAGGGKDGAAQVVPNVLDALQRAVQHCPWSGTLWARYILSAEQAGLSFSDIELIKHAATGSSQLDRDGMTGVLEMYTAWCGYLKRTAMNPHAPEEAVDLADVGLTAALEDVRHWGKRKYGDAYQGDPNFRLEKIYIQYLTEKHEAIEQAREQWNRMAEISIHANSYDFWLNFYLWEMLVFQDNKARSPTPSSLPRVARLPTLAAEIFGRALRCPELDWPERVMEVYLQHCNDYQLPDTLLQALDTVYSVKKGLARRREKEAAEAQAAYARAQDVARSGAGEAGPLDGPEESPSAAKRKRGSTPVEDETTSKRAKSEHLDAPDRLAGDDPHGQKLKRDRENTSVLVTDLPADATMTKVRQYFRDYGHVNNITVKTEEDGQSATAFVEFRTPEDAESALLRDGKYFSNSKMRISVKPATNLTLFVTNYPPRADEEYIRDLFKDCGEIFSIRWPSLKFNTHRRFCYVTFRDDVASAKATALDGKMLEDKYRLEAKYSDPARKKARGGAVEEGRELHVRNLHHDATEDDVRGIFGRYGAVASVRILRTMAGKSKGAAFVVFDAKADAERAAAELDKTKYRSQLLGVEVSKPAAVKFAARSGVAAAAGSPASPSPGPGARDDDGGDEPMADHGDGVGGSKPWAGELAARTVAVLGIPDTVNDTRVRALLEPIGAITKMTLYPGHGGAVVEFADAATAGRAALAVEGLEIEGRPLRVGEVRELYREKGERRVDRVDVPAPAGGVRGDGQGKGKEISGGINKKAGSFAIMPAAVRRPGAGTLGRGPKRGLGFVGAVANRRDQDTGGDADANAAHVAAAPAPARPRKSNADFKAMFLASGSSAGAGRAETNGHAEKDGLE